MRAPTIIAVLLTPLAAFAAPSSRGTGTSLSDAPSRAVSARQGVVTPPPCVAMDPPPTEEETEARHNVFGEAFLVRKNLTEAFEYISATYINHNPMAGDGPNAALDALGPFWGSLQITVLGTAFEGDMGWLNYRSNIAGEVVDRYRWEAGCIVEHWDQGEQMPPGA
ncbi:hypothetical protein AJ79_06414 [Helicocarpus griseus UAMH5409]|uniref:SnoaL-like domain-containing protein n=1 Tax=Helicocarpus griseus UAMH5409 TaxID=1447875 RepID=A0A2B7XDF4_9EURO|nr:hypothetical protein AJ79_06414 [Helicocarpus griseus UAMH5409]